MRAPLSFGSRRLRDKVNTICGKIQRDRRGEKDFFRLAQQREKRSNGKNGDRFFNAAQLAINLTPRLSFAINSTAIDYRGTSSSSVVLISC